MTAYLWSPDMPVVLHATDLEPLTLRAAAERWLKAGDILTMNDSDDISDVDGITGLVVNFGAVRWLRVSPADPSNEPEATGKPHLAWEDTDLSAL